MSDSERLEENKGICYIKFDKASSAAYTIETMDGKVIGGDPKPVKILYMCVGYCYIFIFFYKM